MGTPLMWLGCAHLLFLNIAIGLFEAWLLSRWGRIRYAQAAVLMILANYVSAWAGYLALPWIDRWLSDHVFGGAPLYHVGLLLLTLLLVTFGLTVLLELPFVLLALRLSALSRARRLGLAVWVQASSYAALILIYLLFSPMSVLTNCTPVRDLSSLQPPAQYWVYFIDGDGWVCRIRLNGSDKERVVQFPQDVPQDSWDGLWFRKDGDSSLSLMRGIGHKATALLSGIGGIAGDSGTNQGHDQPATIWPIDFRPVDERQNFHIAHQFAEVGLEHREWYSKGSEKYTKAIHRLNLASPLTQWFVGYPTDLPGGFVVFEMGEQVVLMDAAHRVGVIAPGRAPLVLLEVPNPQN